MESYNKSIKHDPNLWSGYTKEFAFSTEVECYRRLFKHKNFPNVISVDDENQTMILEHCGESLDILLKNKNLSQLIPNIEQQLGDIWDSLQIENIHHLDVQLKNFTYKDGILYLIDFDIAILDNKIETSELQSIFNNTITHLGRIKDDTGNRDSIVYLHTKEYFTFYFLNLLKANGNKYVQSEPYQIIDSKGGWRDCNQRWVHMNKYIDSNDKLPALDIGSAEGFFTKQIQNKTNGLVFSIEGSSYPYKRQLNYCNNEIKDGNIHLMNFYLDSSNVSYLINRKYKYTLLLSVLHWLDNPDYILEELAKVSTVMFIELPSLNDIITINKKYMEHIKIKYGSIDLYLESITNKKILKKIEVPAHTSKNRTLYIIS
jgi:hypothetical protein